MPWSDGLPNCPQCGYLLRGLPTTGRCPECGTHYSSESKVWTPPRQPFWTRLAPHWRSLPGRLLSIAALTAPFCWNWRATSFAWREGAIAFTFLSLVTSLPAAYAALRDTRAVRHVSLAVLPSGIVVHRGRHSAIVRWADLYDVYAEGRDLVIDTRIGRGPARVLPGVLTPDALEEVRREILPRRDAALAATDAAANAVSPS